MGFRKLILFILIITASCKGGDQEKSETNSFLTEVIAEKAQDLKNYQAQIPERAKHLYEVYLQSKVLSDSICAMITTGTSDKRLKTSMSRYGVFISHNIGFRESEFRFDNYIYNNLLKRENVTIEHIQIMENEILTHLLDQVFVSDLKLFDSYTAIPYEGKRKITERESYKANIMMAVMNSQHPFKLVFSEENWHDTLTLDNSGLIEIDQSKYKIGKNHFEPVLIFKTERGEEEATVFIDFEVK